MHIRISSEEQIGISAASQHAILTTAAPNCMRGGFGDLFYENTTGRNDFSVMKVAQDAEDLYFYVRTVATITSPDGYHWMNLFLRTNGTPDWYGYDFALNRISPANGEMILEKCLGGWNWTETARIPFRLHGNEMHLRIPRNTLGFVSPCAFEFKWADNYQSEGDVSAFYADGDAAPLGRLNFIYSE